MRRWRPVVLTLALLVAMSPLAQAKVATINLTSDGCSIQVTLMEKPTARLKTLIEKDNGRYFYDLPGNQEWYPLQMGPGSYRVHLLEHDVGNTYKFIQSEEVAVSSSRTEAVFLSSVQNIPWKQAPLATAKARELTSTAISVQDKLKAIYDYITENIAYDDAKAANLASDYLPSPDGTISSGRGVCYDYASLLASMLRSVGIPSKLVMGTAMGIKDYHAWNEVYVDGQWSTMDVTYDARIKAAGLHVGMTKNKKDYQSDKVY
ncbi:MAG TPA: transglutaminase-like domain-containing protein [bacterium]|nr:transglutaminase-like domain-containing protein [bacterium]